VHIALDCSSTPCATSFEADVSIAVAGRYTGTIQPFAAVHGDRGAVGLGASADWHDAGVHGGEKQAGGDVDQREQQVDTATAGTTPMRWLEHGPSGGVAVVLLHGIPTSPLLWRHVAARLEGMHVLALEMVGYGDSIPAGQGRDVSVRAQSGYLLDWLEVIGIQRAVLVGHDLGGGVAQIAALRRPDVCAGLVLTNAISFDSWPIPSVTAMQKAAAVMRRLPDVAIYPSFVSLLRRGHDSAPNASDAIATHWPPYVRHGAAASLLRQVQALDVGDTVDVSPRLADLDVPARVVWGEADQFQKVSYGERLAAVLRTPLRRIAAGRHFTPEDHPDELAAAITEVHTAAA
jgi:pimeloyl-ACP methyl ester carboxylesterase